MNVIETSSAQCRDCYRCVRLCPLKSIAVTDGHASIIETECIQDGRCSLECPQGAKKIVDHWPVVRQWLADGEEVVISVAPSYLGLRRDPYQLLGALYETGVARIEETAWVVPEISRRLWEWYQGQTAITSSCPAVVALVEKHFPDLVTHLIPVVSPMVLHGRSIRQRYPQAKVVFLGPCAAKKQEREQFDDDVDLSLSFEEAIRGISAMGIDLELSQPVGPDITGSITARQFPVSGGWRLSRADETLSTTLWTVTGFSACLEFLKTMNTGGITGQWAELMLCDGGCLGGPGWDERETPFVRQSRLWERLSSHQDARPDFHPPSTERSFCASLAQRPSIDERAVQEILRQTGKLNPEEQLNCGACGYDSCHAKAEAVVNGNAEVEMCMPYMRRRAESLSHLIIDHTPNGLVVADASGSILTANPAFGLLFQCTPDQAVGQSLGAFVDTEPFQQAAADQQTVSGTQTYPHLGIVVRYLVFPVEGQQLFIGIYSDVTQEQEQSRELSTLKKETVERAREVIERQMTVAQEIAGLLGETTGETKILLSRLIRLIDDETETKYDG